MEYGISYQAIVPVRVQPGDQQEMVNQLLFGDLVIIKGQIKEWLLIETFDDQYEGWVDQKQITIIENEIFNEFIVAERYYSLALADEVYSKETRDKLIFTRGAYLTAYKAGKFKCNNQTYTFKGEISTAINEGNSTRLAEIAKLYLGAPYLWGGRSPLGIDCSGFIQIVFKMCGLLLPRDSSQQVQHGETINFITESVAGDLAFFGEEEGNITHVGIVLDGNQIIHASGKVRIDQIDHQGIFNADMNKYTHQLRVIKRIIS